jgi:hypothetical protein
MFFYSCIFFNPAFQRGLKEFTVRPITIAKFPCMIEAWEDIIMYESIQNVQSLKDTRTLYESTNIRSLLQHE